MGSNASRASDSGLGIVVEGALTFAIRLRFVPCFGEGNAGSVESAAARVASGTDFDFLRSFLREVWHRARRDDILLHLGNELG